MTRLRLLHSNDVHGQIDGLARIATLVEREREEAGCPVLYVDAGDIEDASVRISAVTRGAAMHRLLSTAECDAAAVGNAGWLSYGFGVLASHSREADYPLLLANIRDRGELLDGVTDAVLAVAGEMRVGLIGVSVYPASFAGELEGLGITRVPEPPLVRELAAALREQGADLVVVLSHLGLDRPEEAIDDRRLAADVQGAVDLILGAHSHDLLPDGEWIGSVLVAQAGVHASHLGCIDVEGDGLHASMRAITPDIPLHQAVLAAAKSIEPEVAAILSEPIGTLDARMEAEDAALWLARILRERSGADVGLVLPAMFDGVLPAGTLRRGDLWDSCDSRANPGTATLTGEQLLTVLERGRDEKLAAATPRVLRGRRRGFLQASGAEAVEPGGTYLVAATDLELEPYGLLVDEAWKLRPSSEFPLLVVDVIEEHLRAAR